MTLLTQVVVLHWEEAEEQHTQTLYDIQADGSGRLDWAAVKEAFIAVVVEIKDGGTPGLFPSGNMQGLTRATFQPGSTILVTVSRKAQDEHRATGQTVSHVPLQLSDPL